MVTSKSSLRITQSHCIWWYDTIR